LVLKVRNNWGPHCNREKHIAGVYVYERVTTTQGAHEKKKGFTQGRR